MPNKKSFLTRYKYLIVGLLIISIPLLLRLLSGELNAALKSLLSLLLTILLGVIFFGPLVLLFRFVKSKIKK